jgi:hypothetical protein
MIEGRATGTCSLGPLIRADVAASDSLPGTGLIKWRGSCELLGVFSPQMGAAVTFSYTIQGKATQTIPKKFRVLSSFADPLANNGRGQTTVELGCLLTYMEDAAEPTEIKSRDDDELGNESQSDEDFDAIGASVSARFAFKQCANAIGVSFNFRDGALESTFRVDTIDLKVGYISVMSDLLVSESMVGELDANEVLQIRKLTEATGEAGKLLNTSNILSIAPLNAGELPGENVAVEYSSWRLKEPDSDEGLNSPWEKTIQIGPTYKYMVGTTIVTFGGAFSIGLIVPVYVDMMPVKTNTTTYMDLVVDGTTRSFVKEDETVIVTAVKKQWNNDFTDPTAGEYVWPNGEDDSFALFATDTIRTVYEYDEKGRVVLQETFTIDSGWTYEQKLGPDVAGTGDLPVLMTPQNTKRSVLTGYEKIETTYSENKRRTDSLRLIHKKLSQAGQWQTVWYINNFQLEFGDKPEKYKEDSEVEGLVYQDAQVNYTITPSELENAAPTKTERLSVGSQDDPLERSTETVWVYGDQQSIRRRVFRMPFAPDDLVTGTSGNYSVTPSNAEDVARLFGRVQNKLLFGARYGVQLQLLPVQVPAMAFDALNVDLAGVMGQFRLNNLSYVIEPGEVVCGCNALYWGTIGSTPYSGTASGSWVPLPASSSGYTAPQDMNTVEAGTTFVISSVGTTSQEDWNTLAGTSGVTYSEGDTITAVVDGSTLDSSTGTVSTLQPAPTPTSDATLGDVVVTSPEDVQEPFSTTERYQLSATRGRFLLTGLEADVRQSIEYELAAGRRVFSLTGRQVTQSYGRTVTAGAGALAVTGNDAAIALQEDGGITADAGSFAVAGAAAVVSAEIAPFDPWTPYEIDTALWLDADDAATITEVSGAISQWDDKSTNGYALAQATASKRPAISAGLLNGKDVIDCTVVFDPELEAAGSGPDFKFLHFGQATVVVLARVTVNSLGEYISTSNGTLTPARAKYGWDNGYKLATSGSEGSPALLVDGLSTTLTPLNTWNIVITTTDTAQSVVGDRAQVYINGTQRSPSVLSFATATDTDPQRDLVVCGGDSGWDGQIAEIITLSRVVTTDERQILEGYLAHKWGQTASLPDGHPWKVDSPPSLDFGRGSYAVTGLPADLTFNSRNLAAETGSISLTYKSGDPIPATYSQSSLWFQNEAATAEGMTNGIYAETLQTATDNDSQFDNRDWVQMDFGQQIAFSKVIVGADLDRTLAGGWNESYTEYSSIRASNVGGNNPANWTTLVADIGEFTQGIQEYATPGASYRYVRLVGNQFVYLVVTEFYAV